MWPKRQRAAERFARGRFAEAQHDNKLVTQYGNDKYDFGRRITVPLLYDATDRLPAFRSFQAFIPPPRFRKCWYPCASSSDAATVDR
ncbi:hypothetical protein BH23CHL3_BH23CHL3_10350 [soil metagenome]